MRYFSSDFHINHRNVIPYCARPFASVEDMNVAIVKLLNDTLKPGDTLYFLGDLSLNPKWSGWLMPQIPKGVEYIMIPGNHDSCFSFPTRQGPKHEKMLAKYLADGWSAIHQELTLTLKNGMNVLMAHMPYAPKEEGYDVRYLELRPKDQGMTLLHGHAHGYYKKNGRMIDVGVDAHDFKILSEDDVIALINDERQFIGTSITEHYKIRRATEPPRTNMKGSPK